MEIALSRTHVNGFVIASGDSDSTPLLSKLRELGKGVVVTSTQHTLSGLLHPHCDELVGLTTTAPDTPKPSPGAKSGTLSLK